MTSYGGGDDLLVTSPTCRQLGIHQLNVTQQRRRRQDATTTNSSPTRFTTNNKDDTVTPASSSPSPVEVAPFHDCVELEYTSEKTATDCNHLRSPHFSHSSLEPNRHIDDVRDDYCDCSDVISFRGDVTRNVVLPTAFVRRRNERERQRVRCVNDGFERLRQRVPTSFMRVRGTGSSSDRRISKVETLRAAVRYIRHLTTILTHHRQQQHQSDS